MDQVTGGLLIVDSCVTAEPEFLSDTQDLGVSVLSVLGASLDISPPWALWQRGTQIKSGADLWGQYFSTAIYFK